MVVCKFFLQGTCRFGDNCKFEHQISDTRQTQNATSVLRQQTPQANASNVDVNVLVRSVTNDMLIAEKGGQWLLSSYAPFKDKPPFAGFEDKSFEEVRLGFYEAQKNGTAEQYKQQLQMALQEAIMRIKMLQNPSPDIVNILKSIYNTPAAPANVTSSVFSSPLSGNTASTNIFAQNAAFPSNTNAFTSQQSPANTFSFSQESQSIFGQTGASTPPSVFGGGNQGIFASQQQQQTVMPQNNAFGTQPDQQGASLFAGSGQNIFASQQQSGGSVFATAAGQQQFGASPMFSNQQQQNVGSVLNSAQQTNSPFGSRPPNQQEMGFGMQQPVVSQFAPQQPTSVYSSQPTSIFANANSSVFSQNSAPAVGNAFGGSNVFNTQTSMASNAHTNSIFGYQNTGFGQIVPGQNVDETAYSKLEDLSENEVKVFESEEFEFGQIPEKPPTMQMCF